MHHTIKPLTISFLRCIAAMLALAGFAPLSWSTETEQPEYRQFYNPDKGFNPAQANLTEIFLQIAGSLEHHGSPEPYLRHMQAEHKRVSALFQKTTGKPLPSKMPPHMSDEHIDLVIKNWNVLAQPLQLQPFTKEIGRCAREGIRGTRMTGTVAVQFFNEHQKAVADAMQGKSRLVPSFPDLRTRLIHELEFDKKAVNVKGYETSRRDAVRYSLVIKDAFERKFDDINRLAKEEKAAKLKEALQGWFMDLGFLAQTELELGILDSALRQL